MLIEAFHLALRAILRNALRSSLTVLGIIIGVASVILLVTLGQGATAQVTEDIATLGSKVLSVSPGQQRGPGQGGTSGDPFRIGDVEAIGDEVFSIAEVAPVVNENATVVFGNENWSTSITGTTNAYFSIQNWELSAGRIFTDSELRSGSPICVLGETVRTRLMPGQDPLGEKIRVGSVACQIVGVLARKGQNTFGNDQDDVIVMPIRTVQRRIAGNQDIRLIQVAVQDNTSIERAQNDLAALLRERRGIGARDEDDFRVQDMSQIGELLTGTTELMTALLSAVAAVSLLVGGIGIMNIMLVSVTERTREIGIRLAIGALEQDVQTQFLVEAIVLATAGGVIGIALALAASFLLTPLMGIPFVPNYPIIGVALAFSASVGLIFGYFPARKAARLDPIQALRHE